MEGVPPVVPDRVFVTVLVGVTDVVPLRVGEELGVTVPVRERVCVLEGVPLPVADLVFVTVLVGVFVGVCVGL